ncbi:MAG TPA: phosphoglucosamine mutase, partial [Pirellulaceae bacterium]
LDRWKGWSSLEFRERVSGDDVICGIFPIVGVWAIIRRGESVINEPIISVSGLRGIVGVSLAADALVRYVGSFATLQGEGPMILSRDGRATGDFLADLVRGTLRATGRDVHDAGIAATPTVGRLVRRLRAAGGIQITASHNPPEYNGLKLFGPDGRVVPAEFGERVLQRYRESPPDWARYDRIGKAHPLPDSISDHLHAILARVDVARIRERRFRVVLDSNAGSGSVLGVPLLHELGCDVMSRGGTPNGQFAHPPEPIAENLQDIGADVIRHQADVGCGQDPDADRLALIDAQGLYVGEEYTLALCVSRALRKAKGPIVTNCSTSRMSEDLAQRHGVPFSRSRVGEAHVADEMIRCHAVFGGEGNGGPIDPQVGYVRDSFVGMALVLEAMAVEEKSLRELVDALPQYAMHKTKVTVGAEVWRAAMPSLTKKFHDARLDRQDGCRWDWPDRWLQVRASNTEPIVRVIAEAPDSASARDLADQAVGILLAAGGP